MLHDEAERPGNLFQIAIPRRIVNVAKQEILMSAHKTFQSIPATSMAYRTGDYFGRQDLQAILLTQVKGTARREALRQALDHGQIDEVPSAIKSATLSHDVRQYAGSLHPCFMSGEYLPTAGEQELEIARIHIQSTTGDVTSVYARPVGRRIAYRVVDEYGSETFSGRSQRTSNKPLTMGQLIDFFLGAWDLYRCLECNFDSNLERMLGFFTGESEYYPCFDDALRHLVRQRFLYPRMRKPDPLPQRRLPHACTAWTGSMAVLPLKPSAMDHLYRKPVQI